MLWDGDELMKTICDGEEVRNIQWSEGTDHTSYFKI